MEGLSGQYLTPKIMHEAVEVQLPIRQLGDVEEWCTCTFINKENYTSHIKLGCMNIFYENLQKTDSKI